MFNVAGYEKQDKDQVVAFIRKAQADFKPDLEILSRSILVKDDENVVGMVSYGAYGDMGIVRYFLYDACLAGTDLIIGMFFELYKRAYSEGIKCLAVGVTNEEARTLLGMLGFTTATKEMPEALKTQLHENTEIMTINFTPSFF